MAAAARRVRARLVGHLARRARLSPRYRRDGDGALDHRAVDDQHRRPRALLVFAARRADPVLCRLDGRGAGRLGVAATAQLRPAARLAAASDAARRDGAAQPAARRRRCDRMGLAPARHRNPRAAVSAGDRRHLLCRAAGRLAAAETEDELRSDPRPCDHTESWAKAIKPAVAQAGAAGGFLDHRGADRCGACAWAYRARR